jgi:AraC-like DNA-binding protein
MAMMTSHDGRNDIPLIRIAAATTGESCADLRVLQCQYMREKKQRLHHRMAFHALIVVTRGSGYFCCNEGPWYQVLPGDLFYLRPNAVFQFGPDEGTTWDEYHCCLNGPRIHTWYERGWLPEQDIVWRLPSAESLTTLFRRVGSFHNSHDYGDRDRTIIAAEQLFCEAFHLRQHQHQQHDHLVSACIALFQQRLSEEIHLQHIAEELLVSYSLLRQRIRSATGLSPAKLLLQIRCQQAQAYLQETDMTIGEVASACGFDDQYTFSRSFKRAVGVAPSHWRDQLLQWRGQ